MSAAVEKPVRSTPAIQLWSRSRRHCRSKRGVTAPSRDCCGQRTSTPRASFQVAFAGAWRSAVGLAEIPDACRAHAGAAHPRFDLAFVWLPTVRARLSTIGALRLAGADSGGAMRATSVSWCPPRQMASANGRCGGDRPPRVSGSGMHAANHRLLVVHGTRRAGMGSRSDGFGPLQTLRADTLLLAAATHQHTAAAWADRGRLISRRACPAHGGLTRAMPSPRRPRRCHAGWHRSAAAARAAVRTKRVVGMGSAHWGPLLGTPPSLQTCC
ncbi:hypothetical protein PHYPSEUDO_001814 [Phytophthora pseudosyringae]|uniref:Uncharacterized protein n=1 Tax=Phytophthora pseudosyringae TaxID=221518 RepID=A0A8T1V317_9STRA|nr:hypothetical protein PHYPSEUDO_001814 [Phytophthora pseudosyringae]